MHPILLRCMYGPKLCFFPFTDTPLTDFDITVLWDYFLSHCNRKVLQDWLEFSFLGDSVRHDQMQTLPPLAADIIDYMDNCPNYLRHIIQDQCARYVKLSLVQGM